MRDREQDELSRRATDSLPFVDERAVSGAISTVMEGMHSIQRRGGRIVYPYDLSGGEINRLRNHLRRHNRGLARRIEAIVPTRLEDGMGTVFLIRAKE